MTIDLTCPVPFRNSDKILLAHGSGGTMSNDLIKNLLLRHFDNPVLNVMHDSSFLNINGTRLAFTTDSFVVSPLFFPGGDIGSLSINGTINDLAVSGAKPLYISVGLIIEEGLEMDVLEKIIISMKNAAAIAGVVIATGDTKVVERGKGDKIFINTSGIGIVETEHEINPANCQPGDAIIINGRIAEHGIAIISQREGMEFDLQVASDCCPLNSLVDTILKTSSKIHVMRDPTRGGVASSLNEIAAASGTGIFIEEERIPISEPVKGACEILGFDPLYVANEGKVLVFVDSTDAPAVLSAMKRHPLGADSSIIGYVTSQNPGNVIMKTSVGSTRVVDMLSGEQLPRIC